MTVRVGASARVFRCALTLTSGWAMSAMIDVAVLVRRGVALNLALVAESLRLHILPSIALGALALVSVVATPQRFRRRCALVIVLVLLLGIAWAVGTRRVAASAGLGPSLACFAASALGFFAALRLLPRTIWARLAPLPWMVAGALSVGFAAWDPGRLRGTYDAFDFALFGLSGAAAMVVFRIWSDSRPLLVPLLLLSLTAMTLPIVQPPDARSLAALSPRHRHLDRWLRRLRLAGAPEGRADVVDGAALFEVPPEGRDAVLRFRAESCPRPRNVVWVTIDALRFDATGLGGGSLTPCLDRMASESLAFRRAWAQGPGTIVSVGSMFRGAYPASRYAQALTLEQLRGQGLAAADRPPLAKILAEAGLATCFVTGLGSEEIERRQFQSLPEGFDHRSTASGEADAEETLDRFLRSLDLVRDGRFFAWLHLFDPHAPYRARDGVETKASPRERWASEVRHADRALGRLLSALEARGLRETTICVVNADHGEAFGEHGQYFHATSHFEEQIRVPLVMRIPGRSPAVIDAPVENVAIVPTLLDLLGEPRPASLQARSLLPLVLVPTLRWPRVAFAETSSLQPTAEFAFERMRMVTDGRFKLHAYLDDHVYHLFDLDRDPLEQSDVAALAPDVVAQLRGCLTALDEDLGRTARSGFADRSTTDPREDPELKGLFASDPAVRASTATKLFATGAPGSRAGLERALVELDPDAAHAALLVLASTPDWKSAAALPNLPLPRGPGPLRLRILEWLAADPRTWERPWPTVGPDLSELERRALELSRRRGLAEIVTDGGPWASRLAYANTAAALALANDPLAAESILDRARHRQEAKEFFPGWLRVLAAAGSPRHAELVVELWPSPAVYFPDRVYADIVQTALDHPARTGPAALLALHASASARDQQRLESAIRALDPRVSTIAASRAWAAARFEERSARVAAAYEDLSHAIPDGEAWALVRREIEWGRHDRDLSQGADLEVAIESDSALDGHGTLAVLVRLSSPGVVRLGLLDLAVLRFVWRGPTRRDAGSLALPRILVSPDQTYSASTVIDRPPGPGLWSLEIAEEGPVRVSLQHEFILDRRDENHYSGVEVGTVLRPRLFPARLATGASVYEVSAFAREHWDLDPGLAWEGAGTLRIALSVTTDVPVAYSLAVHPRGGPPVAIGPVTGKVQEFSVPLTIAPGEGPALTFAPQPSVAALVRIERMEFLP